MVTLSFGTSYGFWVRCVGGVWEMAADVGLGSG